MRHVCGGPNVVQLLDVVRGEDLAPSLVFEYINNTDFMVRASLTPWLTSCPTPLCSLTAVPGLTVACSFVGIAHKVLYCNILQQWCCTMIVARWQAEMQPKMRNPSAEAEVDRLHVLLSVTIHSRSDMSQQLPYRLSGMVCSLVQHSTSSDDMLLLEHTYFDYRHTLQAVNLDNRHDFLALKRLCLSTKCLEQER